MNEVSMTNRTVAATIERAGDRQPIPLVDLGLQHRRVAHKILERMAQVMETTSFVLGPQVAAFEQAYAAFCGVQHCIGVGNGTDAIELALRAAGIGPGDEVIIPANTFVATAEAVVGAGARLVLADCDEDFLLDVASVADKLTSRTRAVIGVDLYGQAAKFEEIASVVGDSVAIIEDAAQSHGASRWGQAAGSLGVAASTSFYPGKNLGAYGDAGAVLTHDSQLAERVRELRNHGGQRRYEHIVLGRNSRLDSIQAAVLAVKLSELPAWNHERELAAQRYADLLADTDEVVLPRVLDGNRHVWHLYFVRVADRDRVLATLESRGIKAGIHYPKPIHQLPAYASLYKFGGLSNSERFAQEILSLPIFPGITVAQQDRVVESLRAALGRMSRHRRTPVGRTES
jgi:dTDP-4-amino-4,6-dideoxygalactose transaminase